MTTTIELRGLTKRFGATVAVDDLTASVESGSVTAFLGPNGAGKTTTVLVGKALALAVAGLVFAAATITLDVVLSVVLIVARGANLNWSAEVAEVLAAMVLVMALAGPIGVAVGALVRNQIAAVVGALVWLLVAEQLLVALLPSIGRWTLGGATAGLLQLGREATTHGALLPAWAGGLVLLAYATVIGLLASVVTLRRDLT